MGPSSAQSGGWGGDPVLVVGLGNPGPKYDGTRHNVGFAVIDRLALSCRVSVDRVRYNALTGEMRHGGRRVILCKPQTFMNLSGDAVGPLATFYKIPPSDILVVVDEINLPLGRLRLGRDGSDGGHNGMRSMVAHLSQKFPRLRLGVGPLPPMWDMMDFVLSRFAKEDQKAVDDMVERAVQAIPVLLDEGLEKAMNRVNGA